MAKTSYHLKRCNIGAAIAHNARTKELKYIRKDLSHLNEQFDYTGRTLQKELAEIKKEVKAKTCRKLQKNAEPIQEGVLVIKEDTTIDELKEFCQRCQEKFGIRPLKIFMHKDEGHKRSKTWKPNLHAHIIWSVYKDDGRNVRISREDCRTMQTMAAEVLHMERGLASDKKHVDAMAFKAQKKAEELEQLEEQAAQKQQEVEKLENVANQKQQEVDALDVEKEERKAAISAASERIKGFFGKSKADKENEALKAEKETTSEQMSKMQEEQDALIAKVLENQKTIQELREKVISAEKTEADEKQARQKAEKERDGWKNTSELHFNEQKRLQAELDKLDPENVERLEDRARRAEERARDVELKLQQLWNIPGVSEVVEKWNAYVQRITSLCESAIAAIKEYAIKRGIDFNAGQKQRISLGILAEAQRSHLDPLNEKQRTEATNTLLSQVDWRGATEYMIDLTKTRTRQVCDDMNVTRELVDRFNDATVGKIKFSNIEGAQLLNEQGKGLGI